MNGSGSLASVFDGVRLVLHGKLGIAGPVQSDTDLLADLEFDSLKQLTLVVELENHFQICFAPGDEQEISTVGDIVQAVALRLQEKSGHAPP